MSLFNTKDHNKINSFYDYLIHETPYIFFCIIVFLLISFMVSFCFYTFYGNECHRELNFYFFRSIYFTVGFAIYGFILRIKNWQLTTFNGTKKYGEIKKEIARQNEKVTWLQVLKTAFGSWVIFFLIYTVYDLPNKNLLKIGFVFGIVMAIQKWWLRKN